MTANAGTESFTTEKSKVGEANHTKWVKEVIFEYGSDFRIQYTLTLSDILGRENNKFSWHQNGSSGYYKSDGGFIFYKNKLIANCEHKHQNTNKNACERAYKYLAFMWDYELFISTSGSGFLEETMNEHSGSTSKFLDSTNSGYKRKGLERGVGISHNENEEEFKKTLRDWIEYRVSIVGCNMMLVPSHIIAAGTVDGKFDWNRI